MKQKNSTDGVLTKFLQKAINEEGWKPEVFQELEGVQPPPVEFFTESGSIAGPELEKAPPGFIAEPGSEKNLPGFIAEPGAAAEPETSPAPRQGEPERKLAFRSRAFLRVAAALLLCVLVGGGAMLLSEQGQAEADKQKLEELLPTDAEGLSVVSSQEVGTESTEEEYTVNSERNIPRGKEFFPDLCVPEYIPEGYVFESLYIKKVEESFDAQYLYKNTDDVLLIIKQAEKKVKKDSVFNEGVVEGQDTELGTAYYLEDAELGINGYCIYFSDGSTELSIDGKLERDELKRIAENMKS